MDGAEVKMTDYDVVKSLASEDHACLIQAGKSYGDSWKKRGGVGAFMMLARKWDRIENQTQKCKWDIFEAIRKDPSSTGILDDIKDLRRYLLLVESEMTTNEQQSKLFDSSRV
jgi:hypothetical protein